MKGIEGKYDDEHRSNILYVIVSCVGALGTTPQPVALAKL